MVSIDELLDSHDYEVLVQEGLKNLHAQAASNKGRNEAASRKIFEDEFYFLSRAYFNKIPAFEPEVGVERHTFSGKIFKGQGSIDSMCNQLVIEYKRPSKLKTPKLQKDAINQLREYLESLYINENGAEYTGILTDASLLTYLYWQDGKIVSSDFGKITESDFRRIMLHLLGTHKKSFNARNILKDFHLLSNNNISAGIARFLFSQLKSSKPSDAANRLFAEWMNQTHRSLDDDGKSADVKRRQKNLGTLMRTRIKSSKSEYTALFALQTTYAIIVKLIACRVLTKLEHGQDELYFSDLAELDSVRLKKRMELMEAGSAFSEIRNLLEGDFFSWYSMDSVWNEEGAGKIVELIQELNLYTPESYFQNAHTLDIFEELYMGMIPPSVRHTNGEYFTPPWLANQVLERSIEIGELGEYFTAVDPCCGTGIFLMQLIKKFIGDADIIQMNPDDKNRLVEKILNGVYGVDLNPLSVLAARVNFYLCIRELLTDYQGEIEIPIYVGDSSFIAPTKDIDGTVCYIHELSTSKGELQVTLPACLVESDEFFMRMCNAQTSIRGGMPTEDILAMLLNGFEDKITEDVHTKVKQLVSQLIEFEQNGLGSLWIRIIANYMRVASLKSRDLIIGNPPWVRWSNLQSMYNDKITQRITEEISHIFSGDHYMGGIQLNICALIANRTASAWLSNDGILAFLMPKTLAQLHSYNGFRNFFIDEDKGERLYLQELDDWEGAGNPFHPVTDSFMTYFYNRKEMDYSGSGVPVTEYNLKKGQKDWRQKYLTFEEAKDNLDIINDMTAYQIRLTDTGLTFIANKEQYNASEISSVIGANHYKSRTGVEFTPSEINLLKPHGEARKNSHYKFKPLKSSHAKIKAKSYTPVTLERGGVKSVIRGTEVKAFHIKDTEHQYGIFPFEDGNSMPMEPSDLQSQFPEVYTYVVENKQLIESQSATSLNYRQGNSKKGEKHFYSLGKVGAYTFAPHIVIYRDNTDMGVAAVLQKRVAPWGDEIVPIPEKHAALISQTNDHYFHRDNGLGLTPKKFKKLPVELKKDFIQQDVRNITEEESYYICAILNTPIAKLYFKLSSDARGISKENVMSSIKLPLYNSSDQTHVKLAKIAQKATEQGKATNKQLKSLDKLYLDLCSRY